MRSNQMAEKRRDFWCCVQGEGGSCGHEGRSGNGSTCEPFWHPCEPSDRLEEAVDVPGRGAVRGPFHAFVRGMANLPKTWNPVVTDSTTVLPVVSRRHCRPSAGNARA